MKRPVARPVAPDRTADASHREPRAFAPDAAADVPETVGPLVEREATAEIARPPRFLLRMSTSNFKLIPRYAGLAATCSQFTTFHSRWPHQETDNP